MGRLRFGGSLLFVLPPGLLSVLFFTQMLLEFHFPFLHCCVSITSTADQKSMQFKHSNHFYPGGRGSEDMDPDPIRPVTGHRFPLLNWLGLKETLIFSSRSFLVHFFVSLWVLRALPMDYHSSKHCMLSKSQPLSKCSTVNSF